MAVGWPVTRIICTFICLFLKTTTNIESAIVERNMSLFRRRVVTYFMSMPVIALVNNVLKLGLNEVKLRFRAKLSEHLYKKYMQGKSHQRLEC